MSNPKPKGGSTNSPPLGRQFSLRSLLLLPVPVALFFLMIGRLLAVLTHMRLSPRHIASAVVLGAVIGAFVAFGVWIMGHRILGVSLGIMAWSISIIAYVVYGLGIPLEWIIK